MCSTLNIVVLDVFCYSRWI